MKRHFYFSRKNYTSPDDLKKRLLTVVDHYQACICGLLTKLEVKMAGYWPSSSKSIKTQKGNEANIHSSSSNKPGQ